MSFIILVYVCFYKAKVDGIFSHVLWSIKYNFEKTDIYLLET